MSTAPSVVFDLDDTLIHTSATFDAARDTFAALMRREGFDSAAAVTLLQDIDLRRVEREGFGRTRFPVSMVEAYTTLCAQNGLVARTDVSAAVRAVGDHVYDTPPEPFAHTHDTLRALKGEGCAMYLLTKGDPDVQHFRIESNSLRAYFDEVYIVPRKGITELRHVVATHSLDRVTTWVVGDGIRSDINPAIEDGMLPILVGEKRWQYEDVAPVSSRFYRVMHVGHVPEYVLANGNRPPLPA